MTLHASVVFGSVKPVLLHGLRDGWGMGFGVVGVRTARARRAGAARGARARRAGAARGCSAKYDTNMMIVLRFMTYVGGRAGTCAAASLRGEGRAVVGRGLRGAFRTRARATPRARSRAGSIYTHEKKQPRSAARVMARVC
jgi:hypothetical protein